MTGINSGQVTNAKLCLYNVNGANEGGDFYRVTDNSWQEETVTWNNAPTAEVNLLASLGDVNPDTWYEVDLTSHITADGTYSLRVSDSVGGADYSSKEGSNDPKLLVSLAGTPAQSCTPAATPTATPGPTNTPTNTPTPGPSPTPTVAPTSTATQPPPATFNNATFVYDGDGRRVKSIFNGTTTTYFIGTHYEVTGSTITKYYYAGAQRIAVRTNGTLNYLLGDHLGSTSLTTNASGQNPTKIYYKAWGEVRYASDTAPTKYTYTGQYSYTDDFGLMFYNARWYDPSSGRFAQADTIVPDGAQGYDRYAYSNNNPIIYTDPDGHFPILLAIIAGALILSACDVTLVDVTPVNTPVSVAERLQQINATAEKYGIILPEGQEWAYLDQSDYPAAFPKDYGITPGGNVKETFGDDILYDDNVYIADLAFEEFNEIEFASVMVHESRHAWQEDSYENLGNPLNLPDDPFLREIVTEADSYTVQLDWMEKHGVFDGRHHEIVAERKLYYEQRKNQLLLEHRLPLALPLPLR